VTRSLARDIREGRFELHPGDVNWLRRLLALDEDITRTPTAEERADWDFYRVSARHPVEVWQNAARAWRSRLTQSQVSELVGHSRRKIDAIVSGKTQRPVLTYQPASCIADALELERGAEAFISGLPRHPR
jgi:hypothetical protein